MARLGRARGADLLQQPVDYVANLSGDHLDWLRGRLAVLLVFGQGMCEDTTGALDSTCQLANLLGDRGVPVRLDLWGHDLPHDWSSWRAQLARCRSGQVRVSIACWPPTEESPTQMSTGPGSSRNFPSLP